MSCSDTNRFLRIRHRHVRPGMRVMAMLDRHRGRTRAPHDMEVLGYAEIIAHIASRANGSLSNTGDTDRPRRSPGHVIMSHAAHRGHGRSRTKPAIMRLLDTMLRFWPCAG